MDYRYYYETNETAGRRQRFRAPQPSRIVPAAAAALAAAAVLPASGLSAHPVPALLRAAAALLVVVCRRPLRDPGAAMASARVLAAAG